MRIQNNIMAMNTQRQLGVNNLNQSKSTEKLSSGYRINRAADDASGLSISEKMRSQIRGLNQASANAQDGISLVQAAEGALQETHSILQRMRELSVKAANDINETEDRGAIQSELNQLSREVDRIAYTTEFNKKTLLDGSLSKDMYATPTGNMGNIKLGAAATTGTYDVSVATTAAKESYDITLSNVTAGGTLTLNNVSSAGNISITTTNGQTAQQAADALAQAINADKNSLYQATSAGGKLTLTAKDEGVKTQLNVTNTGTGGMTAGNQTRVTTGADLTLKLGANTATVAKDGTFSFNEFSGKIFDKSALTAGDTIGIKVGQGSNLNLQVGANTGSMQSIQVNVGNLSAASMGIDGLNVDNFANAQKAVDSIESAIGKISDARSNLGAVQNRLEHTVSNLDTVAENLQAAESRIRDVDMAKEMMSFTKNNILSQAATAMLAQANQAPQTVLSLLR